MTYASRFNPAGPIGGPGFGFNTNLNPSNYNPPGPIGGPGRGGGPIVQPNSQEFRQDLHSTYGGWAGVRDARWEGQQPVRTQMQSTADGVRSILGESYDNPHEVRQARRQGEQPVRNALDQFFGIA